MGLAAITVWIAIWTFIFWMNLHRVDVGDLGAWAWSQKADAPLLPAARKTFDLASAHYEYDVSFGARPWVRVAGLALAAGGVTAVFLAAWPHRGRRSAAILRLHPQARPGAVGLSNDEDQRSRRFWERKAS